MFFLFFEKKKEAIVDNLYNSHHIDMKKDIDISFNHK